MRLLFGVLAVALAINFPAQAENWPARQVSVIVPSAAGGTTDFGLHAPGAPVAQ